MTDELLSALYKAHSEVALRGNPSHQALVLAATGSGDYFKSIASALLTYGGLHGPLAATYELLTSESPQEVIAGKLQNGLRIPGWGNGFYKDGIEPAFVPVDEILGKVNPDLHQKIGAITEYIQYVRNLKIWPNPSVYTVATALTVDMPKEIIGLLVVQSRLVAWTQEFMRAVEEAPKI